MIGTSIHHYKITSRLGAGGMGEVWRASDVRLGREVALKLLPKEFASDETRLRRFEQEARTLAALNHPSILAIFDIGIFEGAPYLVSELLEGQTLREWLSGAPLPQKQAIELAVQIAHGLAAAHAKGITHRDLKPENLIVSGDGRVKILDFGLAKLRERTSAAPGSNSQRATDSAQGSEITTVADTTEPGVVLGTPGYMSPEQVRGEATDHRTDIFALGVIIHEMLTGQQTFRRDSTVQTMNAILTEEPRDLGEFNPSLDLGLCKSVNRCLEKRPERRFQSVADLAFALESLSGAGSVSVAALEGRKAAWRTGNWTLAKAGFVAALIALGCGITWWLKPNSPRLNQPSVRFEVRMPEGERLTHFSFQGFALAPDASAIAFVSGAMTNYFQFGRHHIWMRRFDRLESNPIPGTENGVNPVFAPDGRWLAFTVLDQDSPTAALKKIPVTGGEALTLLKGTGLMGTAWSFDGSIVVGALRGGLRRQCRSFPRQTDSNPKARKRFEVGIRALREDAVSLS